jgi:predicted acyltransferase
LAGPAPWPASSAAAGRSSAIDIFRGATVALMILVNNPGSLQHLYPPLAHAPWHGCTATDLVFPFFLTAVGLSLAMVMPGWQAAAASAFWRRWLQRSVLLFLLGLLLNAAPLVRWGEAGQLVLRDVDTLRIMGVLQRIALAWAGAAVVLWWLRWRPRPWHDVAWVVAGLLLGYWALCLALGDPQQPYSLEGYFGTAVDRAWLGPGHLYRGEGVPFDPEGLASTLPAVAQVLLGWMVGAWLHPLLRGTATSAAAAQRLVGLFAAATVLLALGHAWGWAMPINKKLWTSSYVLHTTALAMLALGLLLVWLRPPPATAPPPPGVLWQRAAAGLGRGLARGLAAVAQDYGRNALALFVLSGLVPRLLGLLRWADGVDADGRPRFITPWPWLYREVALPAVGDARLASLAMALGQVAVYWLIAHGMARRGWFIRL